MQIKKIINISQYNEYFRCTNEANALSLSHETYQKIQELSIKLRESENSFIFILKKYITDPSIQPDLSKFTLSKSINIIY